jgi:hypothetical protein
MQVLPGMQGACCPTPHSLHSPAHTLPHTSTSMSPHPGTHLAPCAPGPRAGPPPWVCDPHGVGAGGPLHDAPDHLPASTPASHLQGGTGVAA